MKKHILIILILFFFVSIAQAVPVSFTQQGYLTDSAGVPIDGTVDMTFSLYDVSTGGTSLWSETKTGMPVNKGAYTVVLGYPTPFNLPFDVVYFLGVTVGTDAEMTPRTRLRSAPYAIRAGTAETVADGAVTSYSIGENCPQGNVLINTGSGWACGAPPVCVEGDRVGCYTGEMATRGVGECKDGYRACIASGIWDLTCENSVTPTTEIVGNGLDEDCDGADLLPTDDDSDNYTTADGDCNDLDPLVNPGAYEIAGNAIDDDCDPATPDTAPADCSLAADFSGVTPTQFSEAMGLCQTAEASPPTQADKKWGVISAEFLAADGSGPTGTHLSYIMDSQTAILEDYGDNVGPTNGATMAGMSNGMMRDANDPGYAYPSSSFSISHQPPNSYLAANGGGLPSSQGCSGTCPAGNGANDSVNLRLTIRVPTNAQGFAYDHMFFSLEYLNYACTSYNDYHLALLSSQASGIPADGNIAFDASGSPVTVNSSFIESCTANGCYTCPLGTALLEGTGMEANNYGGATPWLTTQSPVVPGETIILDLMVFDVSDNSVDTNVLFDNFRWMFAPTTLGTAAP